MPESGGYIPVKTLLEEVPLGTDVLVRQCLYLLLKPLGELGLGEPSVKGGQIFVRLWIIRVVIPEDELAGTSLRTATLTWRKFLAQTLRDTLSDATLLSHCESVVCLPA